MITLGVVLLSFVTNVVLYYLMYKGIYIPSAMMPILLALIMLCIYFMIGKIFGGNTNPKVTRVFLFSLTLYLPSTLGSLTYAHWKWKSLISPFGMSRIILVITALGIIYLNFVYIRILISYKRKRGNIRIQKEQPKSLLERWRNRKEGKEEISLMLGRSSEAEDRAPPI